MHTQSTTNSTIYYVAPTRAQTLRFQNACDLLKTNEKKQAQQLLFQNIFNKHSELNFDLSFNELQKRMVPRPHAESITLFA